MKRREIFVPRMALVAAVSLLLAGASTSLLAQDQTQLQDPVYGSQLLTRQERAQYQTKMRSLKTEQEREAFRLEHHKEMQERAKAQGVTLPETPPNPRPGMGPGMGPGMMGGPGGGMGPGYGGGNKQ